MMPIFSEEPANKDTEGALSFSCGKLAPAVPVRLSAFLSFIIVSFALVLFARSAHAGAFDGKWRQGALREDYTVQQWLPGCGPPPSTGSTGGGETVSIQEEGDELGILGGGRTYHTNQCYDPLPTLVRDSHSRDGSGRSWRTRCSTPPSDPRRAVVNTLITVQSDTRVEISETGRYEITLKEGRCIADVKRTRTFDKVPTAPVASASAAPAPAPEPTHAPEPASRTCATVGEPARLEVRPARKLLRTGESFSFQAVVTDAKGCVTPTQVTWAVDSSAPGKPHVTVDTAGKVTVEGDAVEGAVDLVVTAAGKSTHVTVEVSSPSHYDALLAQSGLNAIGETDETSVAVIAQGALGGREATAVGNAVRRRNTFIAVVGGLAAILGLVAFIGWRRARRATRLQQEAEARHQERLREAEDRQREKAEHHAAQQKAHEESVERAMAAASTHGRASDERRTICPSCQREYAGPSLYCPEDGTLLAELGSRDEREERLSDAGGGICPVCKRGFDPGVKQCPIDGEELVPYVVGAPANSRTKGKICPTCGDRFDGSAAYCGKDGTALVLLN